MAQQIAYGITTLTDITDGINTATIYLYRRTISSEVIAPTGTFTYNFITGVLTPANNLGQWKRSIAECGDTTAPIWVITATVVSADFTTTISAWSDPVKMAESGTNGIDGSPGVSVRAVRELYYFKLTSGTTPSQVNQNTYIYADTNAGHWTSKVPAYIAGGTYYTCIEATYTDTNNTKTWSEPAINQALTDANSNAAIAVSIAINSEENSLGALSIATGISQHFFSLTNDLSEDLPAGSYITELPIAEFQANPRRGNLLTRSDGVYLRNGAYYLASFTGTALSFYRPGTTYIDAILDSQGLRLLKGGLEGGSRNSTNYIYVWSEDRGDRGLQIGESGIKYDWRIVAGNRFGVDKAGNLYASNAHIEGTMVIGSGSSIADDAMIGDSSLSSIASNAANGATAYNNAAKNTSTEVQYALSTSSSTAPASSSYTSNLSSLTWTTTNKYVWTRTKITKISINNNTTITYQPSESGTYDKLLSDALATANSASSASGDYAPKSTTVKRTQRIYYRSSSSVKPDPPGQASLNWVTKETNSWSTNNTTTSNWTTKISPMKNTNNTSDTTKYLYLWTCQQTETFADTNPISYTTVLLDDTTTVIDGGTIITGSVHANAINATEGAFSTALIPNLAIDKITNLSTQLSDLSTGVNGAKNTALSYIYYTANTGLILAKSNPSTATTDCIQLTASNGISIIGNNSAYKTTINSNGINIYAGDASNSIAFFGSTARIGKASGARAVTTSNGLDIYNSSNQLKASYGSTQYIYGGSGTYPYLMANSSGVGIYQSNTQKAIVTSTGLDIYAGDASNSIAQFGSTIRIGKTSGQSHLLLDYHSIQAIDKDNNVYFYVSDLRDTSGQATITETFMGDGEKNIFIVELDVVSVNRVLINNTTTTNYSRNNKTFTFSTTPAKNDKIKIEYISNSSNIKAYTFGRRDSNGNIGPFSVCEGLSTIASGTYAHAEGLGTEANGCSSHAEGMYNIANGQFSHVEGRGNTANGWYSHAEGRETIATAMAAHAEGIETVASEIYSHAEGGYTTASGPCSHAEGNSTTASDSSSHAEGGYTTASGSYSHAEGNSTTATNICCHAEGSSTHAIGTNCHAEGTNTTASGHSSHAEGRNTTASATSSHAGGEGTIAQGIYQTVFGKYNIASGSANMWSNGREIFIIGNGSDDNTRSNALSMTGSGNMAIAGTLTQSSDRRLKDHQSYLGSDAVEFIRNLKPAHFKKDDMNHVGFYAQDVEKEDKWNCMTGEMNGFKTLGYTELIAPLVAYCQHLEKRIEELEAK